MATPDIILDNVRTKCPGVVDAIINVELFNTIDELAREALNLSPPTNVDAANTTWLSAGDYTTNYQALLHGTLARLFAHTGKPYSSPEMAKEHFAQYLTYLGLARAEASATTPPATTRTRILAAVRAELPLARDSAINLELFDTTDQIRQEVLQLAGSTSANPDDWLTTTQYAAYYQAIVHGTLARLYEQVGKPWSSTEQAKSHLAQFWTYVDTSRADTTTALTTTRARLQVAIRAQLPMVHDSAVNLELFSTVAKIRQQALRLAATTSTDPDVWLTTDQWADAYQAAYYGTLARLFAQVGKPWSSADLAKANYAAYERELDNVRTRNASAASTGVTVRLVNSARLNLPAAVDETIISEFFIVLKEFLERTKAWQEDIDFTTIVGTVAYDIEPDYPATINSLMYVLNSNLLPVATVMVEPGSLTLVNSPTIVEVLTATVALSVSDPLAKSGYPIYPAWILEKYFDGILSGVLSRVMIQPAKPYSNQQLAIFHSRKFSAVVAAARAEVRHQNAYNAQTWKFPQFAAGRQR